jgi:hypothetical protein
MGPRLLYEAIPGWCLLTAAAVAHWIRVVPAQGRHPAGLGLVTRSGVAGAFVLALMVGVLYAAPRKLASYREEGARSGMVLSAPTFGRPSLVFVHGSWEDRIAARLAAFGMRVDSIRSALAHNSTCELELHLARMQGVTAAGVGWGGLDFEREERPLRELTMPSGSTIRAYPGEALDPSCQRQAASDFGGVLGLPPFLWQGDLPGLESGGAMFVRDLGPERNQRILARFPDREPSLLTRQAGELRLMPYESGMAELWSDSPR